MELATSRLAATPRRPGRPANIPAQTFPPRMIESQDRPSPSPGKPVRIPRITAPQTTARPATRSPKKPQQTTQPKQRVSPENIKPRWSGENPASVYVAVYEHKGPLPTGSTNAMMRESHIVVDHDPRENCYLIHEITDDPSTRGMKYRCSRGRDPRWARPTLLAMDLVVLVPADRVVDLPSIFRQVRIQSHETRAWNSRNFVGEALRKLVGAGVMTNQQLKRSIDMHNKALNLPVLSETPNLLPAIFDLLENPDPSTSADQKESAS